MMTIIYQRYQHVFGGFFLAFICFVIFNTISMKQQVINMIHKKCRNNIYPSTNISRFHVPDDKVFWDIPFVHYNPVNYTSQGLKGKPYADLEIEDLSFKPLWNSLDGNVNRLSFVSNYKVNEQNYPLNPCGRTGLRGRGILGRWGPNHAADPIVTRWKRNVNKSLKISESSKKPILQFVAIQRKDSGEWAIPGGMVDPGEKVSATVRREFMEEALNSLEKSKEELNVIQKELQKFFDSGEEIYSGYVDDPRNTDNAWMETVAFNFHDENGQVIGNLSLQAGDDAKSVKWMDVTQSLVLYASHRELISKVAEKLNANW